MWDPKLRLFAQTNFWNMRTHVGWEEEDLPPFTFCFQSGRAGQDLGGHQMIFEGEFALQERTRFLDLSQKNLDSTLNFDVLFEIVINYKINPKKPQFVAFCCMQDKWRRMFKS